MRRLATSITLTTLLLVVCVMPLWVAAAGGCTADNQCTLNSCCPDSATACTFGAPPLDCSTVQCVQGSPAPPVCICDSSSSECRLIRAVVDPMPTLRACTSDADCVPEQCCHPTTCTVSGFQQQCSGPCTGSCEPDTMDCGQGSCLCNLATGQCNVQWENQSSAAPPGPTDPPMPTLRSCTKDSDCVPEQCCHPTTCVLPELQQRCFAPCNKMCMPDTMDCGRGSCACNLATGKCNVQWANQSSAPPPPVSPPLPAPPTSEGCSEDTQCTLNSCCPSYATACNYNAVPLNCSTVRCRQDGPSIPSCTCAKASSTCQIVWPTTTTQAPVTPPPLPPVTLRACTKDSDCVPEQCCHATTCVLPELQQRCFAPCTGSCEPDTMDCGQGSCACNLATGKCNVQWANQSSAAPPGPTDPPMPTLRSCTKDSDCVPEQCCHPTTCTLSGFQQTCDDVACTHMCTPDSIDCGQGSCACNLATGKCNVQWADHGSTGGNAPPDAPSGTVRLPTWLLGLIIAIAAGAVLVAGVCLARHVCQRPRRDGKENAPVVVATYVANAAADTASQPRYPAVPLAEADAVDMAPMPPRHPSKQPGYVPPDVSTL